jgi:hypothetical protein
MGTVAIVNNGYTRSSEGTGIDYAVQHLPYEYVDGSHLSSHLCGPYPRMASLVISDTETRELLR